MDKADRIKIFKQITWDYNISPEEAEAILKGDKISSGHYTQETLFIRLLESYSWFTLLQIFTAEEIKLLLTSQVTGKLRSPELRKKYEFVRKRLQQIIPAAG